MASLARVAIERMGARGEGVAAHDGLRLYVPYALPGEMVTVDAVGERAALVGIVVPSHDRVPAICPYFTTCGGCAVQAWAPAPYAAWKRDLVVEALSRAGLVPEVAAMVDAHGAGRRRATFHAGTAADGRTRTGFNEARSHAIVAIEACPILDPGLAGALPAARALVAALNDIGGGLRKPLDIVSTATEEGLDIDLRGHGPLEEGERARVVAVAASHALARLSNHGTIVLERRKPAMRFGAARLELPPGAFLQATAAGEVELAARVLDATAGARRVADLFCGVGTFALRLAERAEVAAFDNDPASLAAIDRAARETSGLRAVTVEKRDLHYRPLNVEELKAFDAVVLDPPRAGAEQQMRQIAASTLTRVASVSCDAASFARDAAILVAAGFEAEWIVPLDQFRYSSHIEIVAAFRRKPAKRVRRLLG